MRTIVRSIALVALAAGLVTGCGATAASPAATPAPPDPTGTPVAPATPVPSVGPMDPAYVTGQATGGITASEGTTRTEDGLTITNGVVTEAIDVWLSDPRVSGSATIEAKEIRAAGDLSFGWGTLRIENAGGAWEGVFRGAGWVAPGSETDNSAWLTGSGAYEGLTFYLHFQSHEIEPAGLEGVILAAPPPTVS